MNKIDNKIINVTGDVKWIGILDYDIRTFDIVMHTGFGTTYNSYFINAEKKALVEVAKEKFSETYIKKLRSVTDPEEIQYIIVDHTEPDHSGSLRILLDLATSATVVGSGNAIRYLEDIVNKPFKSLIVDKVLFTCDVFGAHYCSSEMYSDFNEHYTGSFKYYFDVIMRPFSRFLLKAIEKVKPLDIDIICH